MKKSNETTSNEVKNKKVANTSIYLCSLSDRLAKLRNEKNLSQEKLAKQAGTIREKIMNAELNISRKNIKSRRIGRSSKSIRNYT